MTKTGFEHRNIICQLINMVYTDPYNINSKQPKLKKSTGAVQETWIQNHQVTHLSHLIQSNKELL